MNYVDCEVIDCEYQLDGRCECVNVYIDKFGKCKSYVNLKDVRK